MTRARQVLNTFPGVLVVDAGESRIAVEPIHWSTEEYD